MNMERCVRCQLSGVVVCNSYASTAQSWTVPRSENRYTGVTPLTARGRFRDRSGSGGFTFRAHHAYGTFGRLSCTYTVYIIGFRIETDERNSKTMSNTQNSRYSRFSQRPAIVN